MEIWALVMLLVTVCLLLIGYPVAFTLGAAAMVFGGIFLGLEYYNLLPLRIWGIMHSYTLIAVPMFVFMGLVLEKSGLAEELLENMGRLFGKVNGGLCVSVVAVGALLAATTGVVGATVVTMATIALPVMLKHKYQAELASGSIAASGTLGQIIPPSIILVLLGDVVGVPVGRLFMAAVVPGLLLIALYIIYILIKSQLNPTLAPALPELTEKSDAQINPASRMLKSLIAPLLLVVAVLGSIFFGIASPTESAAFGALGAMALAKLHNKLSLDNLRDALYATTRMTSMVFIILIGATAFGLTFRGMHGDDLVHNFMIELPGGEWGFIAVSMLIIFVLGFFLDFIEITFIVVPILAPIAVHFGIDPLWFTVLIALNLQTSFLTPPFGFSLFYLKAAAPPDFRMQKIYKGIVPFVAIQLLTLMLMMLFPKTVLWLPDLMDALNFGK